MRNNLKNCPDSEWKRQFEQELKEEYVRLFPKVESFLTNHPEEETSALRNQMLGRFQKIKEIQGDV